MIAKFTFQALTVLTMVVGLVGCTPTVTDSGAAPGSSAADANSATRQSQAPAGDDRPLVVVTHSVLCDLTRQIAAETVNLKCLLQAGTDPHVYQPTPLDARAIESAQLVLYGGYNFEPDLIRLIKASANSNPKIAVSEVAVSHPLLGHHHHDPGEEAKNHPVEVNQATTAVQDGADKEDDPAREVEPDQTGQRQPTDLDVDPHVWHDAQVGIRMAEVIQENLTKVVPGQAARYKANTQKVTAELSQIDAWIKQQIATIPANSRQLVTTHDALGYYATAYHLPIEAALAGISTVEKPTPARVKALVDQIKTAGVPTIFAELSINPTLIKTVAQAANIQVAEQELFADGLGAMGSPGDTYQKMLISNTETIVKGLGGQLRPFAAP